MLTGEIRNKVDQIWNAFWSGGVSNPLSVIEQITYLLFIKRLDDLHTLEESKAETLGVDMERRIFPDGNDDKGRAYEDMRWSRFKNFEAREMIKAMGYEEWLYETSTSPKAAEMAMANKACLISAFVLRSQGSPHLGGFWGLASPA